MKSCARLGILVLILSPLAPVAVADSLAAPGYYAGSGGYNSNFTVATSNNTEVGLRAMFRNSPTLVPLTGTTYSVPTGPQPSAPTRAIWNWDFSINLRADGTGTQSLENINAVLTVSDASGHTAIVNPLTQWSDNALWGPTGETNGLAITGTWGAQQSNNPVFGDFPLNAYYDMNANQTYTFTLDVFDVSSSLLATTSINVVVGTGVPVPEPASLMLLGAGGMLLLARKRRPSAV